MSANPPAKLDGWKAIAIYLGRNERTAQRWAHERGMPVHHVPGGRSGAVFAFEAEIDAWLQADKPPVSEPGTDGDGAATIAPPLPPQVAPPAPPPATTAPNGVPTTGLWHRRIGTWRYVGRGAALVAVGIAGAAIAMLREPPTISRLRIDGATLEAFEPGGQVAWRFEARVPESGRQQSDGTLHARIERANPADLDADGRSEVLAIVDYVHEGTRTRPGGPDSPGTRAATAFAGSAVSCLTSWGRLQWVFDPHTSLSFAGRRFDGPWHFKAWLAPVVKGRGRLWVSFAHEIWWPSFLVALDANGDSVVQYVSAGHVYALAHLDAGTTPVVLAGGVNNEYTGASLAALDASGPPAASPQTSSGAYYCDGCPSGRPLRYFVFPRSEVNRLSGDPYNRTDEIQVGDSQVLVSLTEGHFEGGAVRTVYEFSRTLDVESVGMSDRYWEAHKHLEREGRLDHPVERCEEYTRGLPVRSWSPSTGWTTMWARQAERAASSTP